MNTDAPETIHPEIATRSRSLGPTALLWLSAAVLVGALVGRWTGSQDGPGVALADMAIAGERIAMLTFDGGNAELCAVLHDDSETLMLYRVGPRNSLDQIHRADLPELFRSARAGRPPR